MRQAKIILLTLVVVTFLGGLVAFKATIFANHFLYTGPLNSGVCTIRAEGRVIIVGIPNCAASTIPLSSGCPNECTTFEDD